MVPQSRVVGVDRHMFKKSSTGGRSEDKQFSSASYGTGPPQCVGSFLSRNDRVCQGIRRPRYLTLGYGGAPNDAAYLLLRFE